MVKNLPATWETQVQSLGWEDPLEKEMATHSSILAWRILWTEDPGRPQSMGSQEADTAQQLNHHHISLIYPVAQTVKRLPIMRETRVRFLGQEDPLEKEMAIHSSTLAWKIPWTEEPDRPQSMGLQRVGHD